MMEPVSIEEAVAIIGNSLDKEIAGARATAEGFRFAGSPEAQEIQRALAAGEIDTLTAQRRLLALAQSSD